MALRRDLEQMIKRLEKEQGWTAVKRRNGHLFLFSPAGVRVSCPATPSDYRGLRNLRAQLRREGADL